MRETRFFQALANKHAFTPNQLIRIENNLNVVKDSGCHIDKDAKTLLCAFVWNASPQGREFWADVYHEGKI